MGAAAGGKKEPIAVADGYRQSAQSRKGLSRDVKARGPETEPSLAIGDGALGFCEAIQQVRDTTRERRCWEHETSNALDKLPRGGQAERMLRDIGLAEGRKQAEEAFGLLVATSEAKYP